MTGDSMTAPTTARCRAVKTDGEPCNQFMNLRDGLCLWHDPDRSAEADDARKRGAEGQAETKRAAKQSQVRTVDPADAPPTPETLDDAVAYAAWAVHAVTTGQIDARTAREISSLLTTFRMGLTQRDLASGLAEVRAVLKELKGSKRGGA